MALALAQTPCYNYNDSMPVAAKYQKCGNSNMCCCTNDDNADTCAQSEQVRGLCITEAQEIWRGCCTDKDWNSEGCIKLCMGIYGVSIWAKEQKTRILANSIPVGDDSQMFYQAKRNYRVTRCLEDGSLCRGSPESREVIECCKARRGVFSITSRWFRGIHHRCHCRAHQQGPQPLHLPSHLQRMLRLRQALLPTLEL